MCNEVIESWNEEAKTVSTNFYEKRQPVKSIIASCQYLLLSDKILSKTKTCIKISRYK